MRIDGISSSQVLANNRASRANGQDFASAIKSYLQDVNQLQFEADVASEQLIRGEIDIHNAMLIAEKANLALELTMAIRNKVVDAYQEIMRMQV